MKIFLPITLILSSMGFPEVASLQSRNVSNSTISETRYLDIAEIFPGQLRYASENVREKVENKIKSGDARWNEVQGHWEYRYHDGLSIFSLQEAVPVLKAPFGYVLVDGHHNVLSSLELGAKQIPVRMIEDLSQLSESEFWDETEKRGLAYLYDLQGQRKVPPREFHRLQDDPNRFFAALSARKCPQGGDLKNSTGAEYPLWIKVGKDIPFIEFQIADVLWQNQLIYRYEMGNNPPEEFVEEARRVLAEAKIPGLRLIAERRHQAELQRTGY